MPWWKIGHRGAAGTRPELTLPSFERATELGVDMIEIDVQLTRDHRLVVLHDRELGRTVRGSGPVRERSLRELCALDAGSWFDAAYAGALVPSLEEVLDFTAGRVALNVEIKSPEADWRGTAEELVALLQAKDRLDATVISSFSMGALAAVHAQAPRARLGVLWREPGLDAMWENARVLGAAFVHPHWALVGASVVGAAHARGLGLLTWTVNEPRRMAELAGLGVDGIISDYPERFSEVAPDRP
jgi:glycerophosphoryl diester phosphodiesterase